MSKKLSVLKKVSLILGVSALLLSVMPLTSFAGFVAIADDTPPEPAAEETLLEEPVAEEPVVQEQVAEEPVITEEIVTTAGIEGPDPLAEEGTTRAKLPPGGGGSTNYNSGLCNSNGDICDSEEPVTQPGPLGEDFESSANIVVFKVKDEYFFFEKDKGTTCDLDAKFCVEFWKDGDKDMVTVYSNWQDKCDKDDPEDCTYHGPNLINFWFIDPNVVVEYGCTDPSAINFNPDAAVDDQSCQFEETPVDPGGSSTPGVSAPAAGGELVVIPVTGVDHLAVLQGLLRNLGMAFMGVSFLTEGIQRKVKR